MHRILVPGLASALGEVLITGDEAHHAVRVKRLVVGERVELLDGSGHVCTGQVSACDGGRSPSLVVTLDGPVSQVSPVRPQVDVWACVPQGSRLEAMVDGLSQVGIAAFGPLRAARSQHEATRARMARIARGTGESVKQCGRAWALRLHDGGSLEKALLPAPETIIVLADITGESPGRLESPCVRLLIGPAGGWEDSEIERARGAEARVCRFGPHWMRVEMAAVVAAGCLLADAKQSELSG